jgi:putative toxin-antitoxin system antitoxin component (TIGR02293 family)
MKRIRNLSGKVEVGKRRSAGAIKGSSGAFIKAQWIVGSGDKVYAKGLTAADKIGIIRAGVSKKQLTEIKEEMDLDYDELSEVLSTSRATLIKKKKTEKFDSQISERIVLLNDVLGYGREVFGDNDNFNEWLRTSSEALGNVTPLSMMDTLYGIDEVKKEIGRIAYGVY